MSFDPEKLGDTVHNPFLIGVLGGIVSLRSVPGQTWKERLFNVFCAMLLAGFFAPGISEFLGVSTRAMQSAVAFAIGVFGLNLVASLTNYLQVNGVEAFLPWKKGK